MISKKWTQEEIVFLQNNYDKMTYKKIGEELNRTEDAVQLKSRKLGLKKPRYEFNKRFFEEINTPEKAYWIGFIFADGYITSQPSSKSYEIGIMLEKSDFEHLKKFNKSLNGNVPVKFRKRKNHLKTESHHKDYTESCTIRLYSYDMYNDLVSKGILENKTYKDFSINNIPVDLQWHFIRGFLDGDGHIEKPSDTNKYPRVGFTNRCVLLLTEIQELLKQYDISSNLRPNREGSKVFQLVISNKKSINLFLEKCYDSATVYLDRKYVLYKQIIN